MRGFFYVETCLAKLFGENMRPFLIISFPSSMMAHPMEVVPMSRPSIFIWLMFGLCAKVNTFVAESLSQ
jgi:hypothetical protein